MKKFGKVNHSKLALLALYAIIAGFFAWLFQPLITARRIRKGRVALANELGLTFEHGRESLQIDPTSSFPIANKFLGYMRGSTQYYAKLWDGGSTAASYPLGISPDAPYQASDFMTVDRLGAKPGTQLGLSAGAITIDHLVGAAANGLVVDLQTAATTYTAWVIGRSTKTVTAASQEITFIPCDPYLITTTGGTLTNPANPL